MTEKDQELMKRYIYQVVRRLPQEQRMRNRIFAPESSRLYCAARDGRSG